MSADFVNALASTLFPIKYASENNNSGSSSPTDEFKAGVGGSLGVGVGGSLGFLEMGCERRGKCLPWVLRCPIGGGEVRKVSAEFEVGDKEEK